MAPISWRDTYDLVAALETKVLAAITAHSEKSEEDHDRIESRLRVLEDDKTKSSGARSMVRSTVALILAVGGLALQVVISIFRP